MYNFFEVRAKYSKINQESGKEVKVNVPYLIEAVNYKDAETKICQELEKLVSGALHLPVIRQAKYSEVFFYDYGEMWYRCNVKIAETDESGKSKKVSYKMLVMADNVKQAGERLEESMQGTVIDWLVVSITETNIADIFTYSE